MRPLSIAIYGKLLKLFFLHSFETINLVLRRKNVQNLLIFMYLFLAQNSTICFRKSFHNSGMIGGGKLSDPSLNCIFNALSIDLQYIPSHFNKLILA